MDKIKDCCSTANIQGTRFSKNSRSGREKEIGFSLQHAVLTKTAPEHSALLAHVAGINAGNLTHDTSVLNMPVINPG